MMRMIVLALGLMVMMTCGAVVLRADHWHRPTLSFASMRHHDDGWIAVTLMGFASGCARLHFGIARMLILGH